MVSEVNLQKIVLLTSDGYLAKCYANALSEELHHVIIEKPVKKHQLIVRRVRKLGFCRVLSQLLFKLIILPFLKFESNQRRKEILSGYKLCAIWLASV